MSLDLIQLKDELRAHLGVDDNDLPDADADLLLNRAYWELLDKFPFREKEVSGTFQTVVGTAIYGMPSPFEALRQLSIEDLETGQHTPLKRMTVYEYEKLFVNQTTLQSKPWGYVRESCSAKLYPTPDQIYTLTIKYWTTLADLVNDTDTPPIPQVWHEIILYGGLWRGYVRLGDLSRSAQIEAKQATLINTITPTEGKEEFDSHTAGVEVLGRDYEQTGIPDASARQSNWLWNHR